MFLIDTLDSSALLPVDFDFTGWLIDRVNTAGSAAAPCLLPLFHPIIQKLD